MFSRRAIMNESMRILSISVWRRRIVFWTSGILTGLFCVLFAIVCDSANRHFHAFNTGHPYLPLVVTPVGFMLIMFLTNSAFKGAEGSGIPQVIAALELNNIKNRKHLVSFRIAIGKFVLTPLGLLCGGSIGREGPAIQLSASLMHAFGKFGQFNRHDTEKGLLLAGGAAGIAAAFNAPLAGIVFAIEELSGSFEKGVSGTIITTVVICGIIAQTILGNYSYFGTSNASINVIEGGLVIILATALLGGLLGGLFSFLLLGASAFIKKYFNIHPILLAGIMGLAVAALGIASHGITFGNGYLAAKDIITNHTAGDNLTNYGPLKMLANLLSFLSGIPGGIFAPSLSAGAGFGEMLSHHFTSSLHDAIVLLMTVAYFSGVVQSPITAFVIVLEMSNSTTSNMVFPIMLTSLVAAGVSKILCRRQLYAALAERYLSVIKTVKEIHF